MKLRAFALLAALMPVVSADDEECAALENEADYRGDVSKTVDGVACVNWWEEEYDRWPEGGLYANSCRNPDDDPLGAWCFTSDSLDGPGQWGYCDVPKCKMCADLPDESDYRGPISVTTDKDKRDCLKWWAGTSGGTKDNNFCRNPNNNPDGAWCVTAGDTFRHCEVPKCSSSSSSAKSASLAIIVPVVVAAVLLLFAVPYLTRKRRVNARQPHRASSMPDVGMETQAEA